MTRHDQSRPAGPRSGVPARQWDDHWMTRAQCGSDEAESLFVPGAAQHVAKRICGGCPVRTECLVEALDDRIEEGVWGGLTERERRAVLRRHPEVTSWRAVVDGSGVDAVRPAAALPGRPRTPVPPAVLRDVRTAPEAPVDPDLDRFFAAWPVLRTA